MKDFINVGLLGAGTVGGGVIHGQSEPQRDSSAA